MGIDLLDITFRVERRYGVRLKAEDLQLYFDRRQPGDISMAELHEALQKAARRCVCCRHTLGDPEPRGVCPECGTAFDTLASDQVYEELRRAVADALAIDGGRIRKEDLLIRDLGLS